MALLGLKRDQIIGQLKYSCVVSIIFKTQFYSKWILVSSSKSIDKEQFSNLSIKNDSGHVIAFSSAKRTTCAKKNNKKKTTIKRM